MCSLPITTLAPLGPLGKFPVVKTAAIRLKVNLISAINARGFKRFIAVEENVTSSIFIDFLKRLIDRASGPIFLIVANYSVHKSKEVKDFVKGTDGKLRWFHLQPYSPELNPDKHVWNYLKNYKIGRQTTKNGYELSERVESVKRSIQKATGKDQILLSSSLDEVCCIVG